MIQNFHTRKLGGRGGALFSSPKPKKSFSFSEDYTYTSNIYWYLSMHYLFSNNYGALLITVLIFCYTCASLFQLHFLTFKQAVWDGEVTLLLCLSLAFQIICEVSPFLCPSSCSYLCKWYYTCSSWAGSSLWSHVIGPWNFSQAWKLGSGGVVGSNTICFQSCVN